MPWTAFKVGKHDTLTDGQQQSDCGLPLMSREPPGSTSDSAGIPFNSASVSPLIQTGLTSKGDTKLPFMAWNVAEVD